MPQTSQGTPSTTGPGRPSCDVVSACASSPGRPSGSVTRSVDLAIDSNIAVRSDVGSSPDDDGTGAIAGVSRITTIGVSSWYAVWTPIARLAALGPRLASS